MAAMTPDWLAFTLMAALSTMSQTNGRDVREGLGGVRGEWRHAPVSITATTSFSETWSPTATQSSPSSPITPSASGIVSEMKGASSVLAPGVGAVASARRASRSHRPSRSHPPRRSASPALARALRTAAMRGDSFVFCTSCPVNYSIP
eukprot:scaffold317579_cov35-Tisochrysis_lutea.AAC.3